MTAQDRRGQNVERTGENRTFPQKQNSTEEKDRIVQENLIYNKIVQREKDRIVQYITIQQITGHCISREIEKYLQNIEGLHKKKNQVHNGDCELKRKIKIIIKRTVSQDFQHFSLPKNSTWAPYEQQAKMVLQTFSFSRRYSITKFENCVSVQPTTLRTRHFYIQRFSYF